MTPLFVSVSAKPGRFGTTVYTELFRRHGIQARYEARVAPSSGEALAQMIRSEKIAGCSVSMPLKDQIIPYLEKLSETVQATHSCNTVYWKDGQLCGENTDVDGLRGALQAVKGIRALIYGYGGVLGSIVTVVRELGFVEIWVTGRSPEKAQAAAKTWGLQVGNPGPVDLVLVAAPLDSGVSDELKEQIHHASRVFELAVVPSEVRALARGKYIPGVEMAIHQLVRQFEIYTGQKTSSEEISEIAALTGLV